MNTATIRRAPRWLALCAALLVSCAGYAPATTITLSGTTAKVSGTLGDGRIVVDSTAEGTVRLVLGGVDIHSEDGPAIHVKDADELVITLAEGTQHVLSDGATYAAAPDTDTPDAVIFSEDDITIEGSGKLTVRGACNNGIATSDDLVIAGGTIVVESVDDGLLGRDSVTVKAGSLTIKAGGGFRPSGGRP